MRDAQAPGWHPCSPSQHGPYAWVLCGGDLVCEERMPSVGRLLVITLGPRPTTAGTEVGQAKTMRREKARRVIRRLESPHDLLTLARWSMGMLGLGISAPVLPMFLAGQHLLLGGWSDWNADLKGRTGKRGEHDEDAGSDRMVWRLPKVIAPCLSDSWTRPEAGNGRVGGT